MLRIDHSVTLGLKTHPDMGGGISLPDMTYPISMPMSATPLPLRRGVALNPSAEVTKHPGHVLGCFYLLLNPFVVRMLGGPLIP